MDVPVEDHRYGPASAIRETPSRPVRTEKVDFGSR